MTRGERWGLKSKYTWARRNPGLVTSWGWSWTKHGRHSPHWVLSFHCHSSREENRLVGCQSWGGGGGGACKHRWGGIRKPVPRCPQHRCCWTSKGAGKQEPPPPPPPPLIASHNRHLLSVSGSREWGLTKRLPTIMARGYLHTTVLSNSSWKESVALSQSCIDIARPACMAASE